MIERPTKAEILEWKDSSVTRYLMDFMREEFEELKNQWANADFTTESVDGTAQLNARAIGEIKALGGLMRDMEDNFGAED